MMHGQDDPGQGGLARLAWVEQMLMDQGDAICALDLDDRVIFVNRSAECLLGRPRTELMGLSQRQIFGAAASDKALAEHRKRSQHDSSVYDLPYTDPAGQTRTLLVTGSPLHDSDGRVMGSFGVLRDISERRRREEAVERRLRLVEAVSQAMRALLTQADFDQAMRDALEHLSLLLGARGAVLFQRNDKGMHEPTHEWMDEEGLLGDGTPAQRKPVAEGQVPWWMDQLKRSRIVHLGSMAMIPADAAEERRIVERLGLTNLLAMAVNFAGRCQGFVVFENLCATDAFSTQDMSLLSMLSDIFASALSRRRTESDRGLLITAVEQADASIVITDAEGRILYVNPAFERVSGYSRRDALGKNPRLLKGGRHDAAFYRGMWDTLTSGMVWTGTLINKRKNGTLVHESCTISPISNSAGEIVRYVAVKRDLSKELALETQLRQSQMLEAVGRLAAGVAHEINTPSQYISDNLNFLSESLDKLIPLADHALHALIQSDAGVLSEELRQGILQNAMDIDLDYLLEEVPVALRQSMEGLERVTGIVRAMKDFSHPGSQNRSSASLNRMIQSTVMVSRGEWKHVAELVLDLDESLPEMPLLVAELNQALLNLIINAAHAIAGTGAGSDGQALGRIILRTRRLGNAAFIEVEDTGGGIPEEVQPHIFEPFFTTKDVGKGTGQGLAVTRSVVVDKHGGLIAFESWPGRGTCFRITLPLDAADETIHCFAQEGVA